MKTLDHEPLTDPSVSHANGWLARLGSWSTRRRRLVIVAWLALAAVASPLAVLVNSALSGAGWDPQDTPTAAVRDELRRDFPELGAEAAVIVFQ